MEIRHGQQFPVALGNPVLLGAHLASGAMTVAAGMINVACGAANIALLDMPTQSFGAASQNGTPCFALRRTERMIDKISLATGT